ncbi:MAG: hypothetical protein ACYTHN_17335 [Planctomycetota bacterium]
MRAGEEIGHEEICRAIPHRGRNLVVDRIAFFNDEGPLKGRSTVRITPGEAEGRDIFLQEGEAGPVYSEFVLVEHVALTSSVLISPDTGKGRIAFFSTITNFRGGSSFPAGEEIVAMVTHLGRRGPFHRSRCRIGLENGTCGEVSVELMAAVVESSGGERVEAEKKAVAPPRIVETRPVDKDLFRYKDDTLVFVDEECMVDRENRTLTARYVYPPSHPFVPGHFPGNPVMMGVTQWGGMLDSALWLAYRLELPQGLVRADGKILRADGTLVTEITGLQFRYGEGSGAPQILATKRIGFRDMVLAGEEIFYRVRLQTL